jgi:cellulose synthase/poly-beta-1,6-N-acetylglucosamine synthase-like glycosyltransferase
MSLELIDFASISVLLLVSYISIFYLILWLENKNKLFKRGKTPRSLPGLSVIIPAYNEGQNIKRILNNLLSVTYPKEKLEIIVVDDGSTDHTYEVAKSVSSRIRIFKKKHSGKAASINFGIMKTKNDFVAVVDADSILSKNALVNSMKYFDDDVSSVTARILVMKQKTIFEKWQDIEFKVVALSRKVLEGINLIFATPGPLSIYRKDVLKKIGMFDEKNLTEDVEIAWRLLKNGYKIRMAYDALVYSYYPENFSRWWSQRIRWNIGGFQTIRKYLHCTFKNHPVGTFLIPMGVLGSFFSLFSVLILFYILAKFFSIAFIFLSNSLMLHYIPDITLTILPDLFAFYGAVLFFIAIYFLYVTLRQYHSNPGIFTLLLFFFVYPFLSLASFIYGANKYFRREYSWGTK